MKAKARATKGGVANGVTVLERNPNEITGHFLRSSNRVIHTNIHVCDTILRAYWVDNGVSNGPQLPTLRDYRTISNCYSCSLHVTGRNCELLKRTNACSLLSDSCS